MIMNFIFVIIAEMMIKTITFTIVAAMMTAVTIIIVMMTVAFKFMKTE